MVRCDELLGNPLMVPAYPRYLSGFVHALEPVPGLADFVVEMVSNAFGRLPDPVLLPWLPTLIGTLRSGGPRAARRLPGDGLRAGGPSKTYEFDRPVTGG
jgi:hypothetical protein